MLRCQLMLSGLREYAKVSASSYSRLEFESRGYLEYKVLLSEMAVAHRLAMNLVVS